MAEVKIVGNIETIRRISRFDIDDTSLLRENKIVENFNYKTDYIELFLYDSYDNLLDYNLNYKNFKLAKNSYYSSESTLSAIEIDPIQDIYDFGYNNGFYKTQYTFFRRKFNSFIDDIYISEISTDRTEVKINSINLNPSDFFTQASNIIQLFQNTPYQNYLILSINPDIQIPVINIAIDTRNNIQSVVLKLYRPLSTEVNERTTLWISEEIIEPYVFDIDLNLFSIPDSIPTLKGPNFNADIDLQFPIETGYETYSSIISSLTGSSYHNIINYLSDNSYDLNIDYTSFNNFIHFSSAQKRLEVFYDKVKNIEKYYNISSSVIYSSSLNIQKYPIWQSKINDIITNFDGYERYLYFESSSYAWPKSSNIKPYSLSSTTSSIVNNWYITSSILASEYDDHNADRLYYSIPEYIKNDIDDYQPYFIFIDMIGHYFDNIWIYITSINELYNNDNNLEKGVSKDLIYDALQSLGVKLYNSKGGDDFDQYINGLNEGSTVFNNNFTSGSSYLNNIPKKDILSETYKRIYHNLILLNKQKGTSVGLQNLINVFGVTGSILRPKEIGGNTKSDYISIYDNNKINIPDVTVSSNVLSPHISIQNQPTASSKFTSMDLHFVDVSFSPQNELNARISSSISLLNPTFNIDNYIGDPGLIESSSYGDLINQNNYYISASSAVSGGAKPLDYKGFIELIKIFDSSLFKMLKDFVPARTNLLTGITVKSPILERNKIPQYKPKITNENVLDAEYNTPIISEDNDYYYDKLGGTKSSFYNGEIEGLYIDVNDYFENSNPNTFLHPTSDIDIDIFNHTDFNVTLNNISSSILSDKRYKLEKRYENINGKVYLAANEISSSAELQDSNLSLKGHLNSRYDGTKLSSLKYNVFTEGDNSFGKTSAIDHNTRKIGLFTQVQSNKFLNNPKRNNFSLTYLVDEKGNLTELNKKNYNLFEIQNTFKFGDTAVVSLFDNQKYSDQRIIEGSKKIFNSGYEYYPSLYFSSNNNSSLYFNFVGEGKSRQFKINTNGGLLSGSNSTTYKIINGNVFGLFDSFIDKPDNNYSLGNNYFGISGPNTFPTYSVQEKSNQRFIAKFNLNVKFGSTNHSGSFTFNINKVGSSLLASQTQIINSGYNSKRLNNSIYPFNYARKSETRIVTMGVVSVYNELNEKIDIIPGGTYLYKVEVSNNATSDCDLINPKTYYVKKQYYDSILTQNCDGIFLLPQFNKEIFTFPEYSLQQNLEFNLVTDYNSFNPGDKIGFELITSDFTTPNFTASIDPYYPENGIGTLYSELDLYQTGNLPFASNNTYPYLSGSLNNNTIFFSSDLSYYYNYKFLPSGSGVSVNALYNQYGYVDNVFQPQIGDIVVINYGNSNNVFESEIKKVYLTDDRIFLELNETLPNSLNIRKYNNNSINQFLFLSRKKSENNIILTFDKPPGNTSLGLLIPSNLHPDMLKNIDAITKALKGKLVDAGNIGDGGSF
jgi:hypothetical protein